MMQIPSKRELKLYDEFKRWIDHSSDTLSLKKDAPESVKKSFEAFVKEFM